MILSSTSNYKVILIMGVGGPATYGLAHLLTGRPPECMFKPWEKEKILEFTSLSERFLSDVNELIEKNKAVEAIIEITVLNNIASTNNQFEDSREFTNIQIPNDIPGITNPKPFSFVGGS